MTHTENGLPIVPMEICQEVMSKDNGMDDFDFMNEFYEKMINENKNLAMVISSQAMAFRGLGGDQMAMLYKTAMLQVLSILEKSEQTYMKG
ncbi:MAG: hypothetical protein ACOC2U_05250 [bacterium]